MSKYQTHEQYKQDWVVLSDKKVDATDPDNFLIDICLMIRESDEYQDLTEKPNFGREEATEEQVEVNGADNVYTLKHFIAENIKDVRTDKKLQQTIKGKLERLKKLIKPEGTEYAQLMLLELQINDMIQKSIEEEED